MQVRGRPTTINGDEKLTGEDDVCSLPRKQLIADIAAERRRLGITQRTLAERTGLKQSNISRLETGKSNPSLDFLSRVAAGLGKELQVRLR